MLRNKKVKNITLTEKKETVEPRIIGFTCFTYRWKTIGQIKKTLTNENETIRNNDAYVMAKLDPLTTTS